MSTHWALTTGLGLETVTRFTDHANNSDKFRRFIAIQDPNDRREKILLTQTGRWTTKTARGNWNGGTYRFIKEATFAWEIGADLPTFLQKNVEKKLGNYSIQGGHGVALSSPEIAQAVRLVKAPAPWMGGTPAGDQARRIVLTPGTPVPAFQLPDRSPNASFDDQVAWLLSAVQSGRDRFELLSHYSQINVQIEEQRTRLEAAASQLQTALNLIMLKEA